MLFFISGYMQKAVEQDKIPAWGTTMNISLLSLGVPLFVLLLGWVILWIYETTICRE